MIPTEIDGSRIIEAARAVIAESGDRAALHRALLDGPLAVPLLGPGAAAGPTLRIEGLEGAVRPVESIQLGGLIVPLYPSIAVLRAEAAERGLWPDGVPRLQVFERGAAFGRLRTHPGALLCLGDTTLPIDAGEVAALADLLEPNEYFAQLQKLVAAGRGREAARKLSTRMFYVLGHPGGGMVMFQRELPVFLHQQNAIDFAERMAHQMGRRPDHALVAAAELFKYAVRGKLTVLVAPGPHALRLRFVDLR